MPYRIISKSNKNLFSVDFRQRVNAFFILVLLHLMILNSVDLISYINLMKSEALNGSKKSLVEALADNFGKIPEIEKRHLEDVAETVLVYIAEDYFIDSYSIDNRNMNFILKFFHSTLSTDVITPPPKGFPNLLHLLFSCIRL